MWPILLYLRMSEDIFELNRWILISSEAFQPQRKGWNEPVTLCNLTICVQEEESIPFLPKAFEVICITCILPIALLAPLSLLKCHVYIDLLIELFMSGKGSMAACSFFKMGHRAGEVRNNTLSHQSFWMILLWNRYNRRNWTSGKCNLFFIYYYYQSHHLN